MKREDIQRLIATIAAAALTSTGCDNRNHIPTLPTPTAPPPIVAPPAAAAGPIDGVYRLTFTAAPSCQLPDDVMRRMDTATITTFGGATVATRRRRSTT